MTTEVKAFLDLVAWSEGTSTSALTKCGGYDVIVSGPGRNGGEVLTSFAEHPFEHRPAKVLSDSLKSTAAGRYQILLGTWHDCHDKLHLPDFSPASQDAVAVQLLLECKALPFILAGNVAQAFPRAGRIWASLPGSPYGQPTHPLPVALAQWASFYKPANLQEAA